MDRRWESFEENAKYEGLILPALLQAAEAVYPQNK
jgi:hypothetical protein